MQKSLIARGYDIRSTGVKNVLDIDKKAALVEFQKENNLPVGNLDKQTIIAFRIEF